MSRKRIMGLLALSLMGLSACGEAAKPMAPKLVVAIAVDQFSYELFQRYRTTFTGGLKRLSNGMVFQGYQSHAATETCPGHSTILTGDHPARTGIVANNWFDRKTGANMYCVSVPGNPDSGAAGSTLLRVDTLGDWTKAQKPGSRTIAVSGKDRAAIMMAGHHPDAVYWWNDGGGFATTRDAGPMDASVLEPAIAFNRDTLQSWRAAPPQLWPQDAPDRCKAMEKPVDFGARGTAGTLPPELFTDAEHSTRFLTGSPFAAALRYAPLFDTLALGFAEKLMDEHKLGHGPGVDLLAVSLSTTDYVGHYFGNGGPEMCVQVAALDQALGAFFDQLDKTGVSYVVALTADHGAMEVPERAGPPAQRIDTDGLVGELSNHLRQQFALDYAPLAGDDARQIILNLAPGDDDKRPAMRDDAMAWLKARPEVAGAWSGEEIAKSAPARGKPVADLSLPERFHESYDPERSGDILIAYAEHGTLGIPASRQDSVAGHGSPWDYDRQVPILFWWKGVKGGAGPAPIETVDIAPTLAAMIGVKTPAIDGHCIELGQGCPKGD